MPSRTYQNRPSPASHSSTTSSSDASEQSKSTAPTIYSHQLIVKNELLPFSTGDARDSNSTYASTVSSSEDLPQKPQFEVVADRQEVFPTNAIPSNSSTFADVFPSGRRLLIRHDDSTLDGNMNLRIDTLLLHKGRMQQEMTLFHLRMHDLRSRTFSFRRYCRDSGREVCHSRRLAHATPSLGPALRRSWSSVLSGMRPASNAVPFLHRQDYSSKRSPVDEEAINDDLNLNLDSNTAETLTNSILLEFSNYARVELSRINPSKRYEFEYWSTKYQWRRECRKEGDYKEISYHLVNLDTSKVVAHIVPEVLTPMELVEEESKGGWVPPCSLWISDASVYERMHDIADAIVATGVIALADDSIRRRWHSKRHVILNLTRKPSLIDSLGPKRLIDEMFHRRGSA
ncbi:hypothetical protein BGW36DRAFT_306153 [Talaromyces proteolyticus]|uniref:Uncharacterized protein n=1 Tax=Talaromyces proteolyticus TaxID=1131652 RepID=A0AAD4PW06_9EURO|nr:uncharacterized protein BGW36DRAFT_306153 [Talaromyces proteolyticus]KAH8690895.1 hypothetical protein BGW36DRAFT_306153 [Talaromyces proteolyticus]